MTSADAFVVTSELNWTTSKPSGLDSVHTVSGLASASAGTATRRGSNAASKAAVNSFAKTLSTELLPHGARVNVVSPGPVETPLYGKLGLDAATLDETAEKIKGLVPIGRFGTPDEIAATVLHLSAPESAFIVGAEIIASGGMGLL